MPELQAEAGQQIRFDLRREKWIPVVREDGTHDEVGLLEVLGEAHQLREIRDPLPPVECGLQRLLVTFVLDIFQPRDATDWEELWNDGRFDEARIQKYFKENADRFDLFDEAHPFLQSADAEGDDKPLAGLLPSQPAGTNAAHFQHGDEGAFAVSPAIAARLLTTIAPFMTAGGAGLSPSINGAPPWYVLPQGRNLFETILLNCPVLEDLLTFASGDAPPAWRDERPIVKEDRTEAGLLESLTWRPRRIHLRPHLATNGRCALSGRETPVLVSRMKFSAGWSTRFEWRDPHVPYRIGKEGATVLRPRDGREIWRDVGALALLRHTEASGRDVAFERPAVVTQFSKFAEDGLLREDVPLQLAIYGMRTDLKMKVFEWHRERLNLPAPLLWKQQFHGTAENEMKRAEDVAYALGRAIKHTYPRDGAGNDNAFETLIARTHRDFWQRLRPHYTDAPDSLLHRLAPLQPERDKDEIATAQSDWHKALSQVARRVLDTAISGLDTDGEALKRQIEARRNFEARLWALLHPEAAAKKRKAKQQEKGETV